MAGVCFAENKIVLKQKILINACSITFNQSSQVNRRGCCSHHGGVCGCSGGRATCCDGQLSPTCGCNSDSIKEQFSKFKG